MLKRFTSIRFINLGMRIRMPLFFKYSQARTISAFLIFLLIGCLDRLNYEIPKGTSESVTITGYISNQPPPYEVKIFNVFDIESKESIKTPLNAKRVVLFEEKGTSELLTEVNPGTYQTSATGINGKIGGVYKIQVELLDGRIYESIPDTILAAGSMDSVYYRYTKKYNEVYEEKYYMDVFFDASYQSQVHNKFMWRLTTTFKATTKPELNNTQCFWLYSIGQCNFAPPCSGYRNVGSNTNPILEKQLECTCCDCWYSIFNDDLILSDQFVRMGQLKSVFAKSFGMTPWMFQYKTRIDVSQLSLTTRTYNFWKAIRDQKVAIGSLFQPITGKIPNNFIKTSGKEIPAEGIFYATSVSSKTQYLTKNDLPPEVYYKMPTDSLIYGDDCRNLFTNSNNLKPPFWKD